MTTPAHRLSDYEAVYEYCAMFPYMSLFTPHEKVRSAALRATLQQRAPDWDASSAAALAALEASRDVALAKLGNNAILLLRQKGIFMQEVQTLADQLREPVLQV